MNNGQIMEYRRRRGEDGAWMLDEADRFYRLSDEGERVYGYLAHFTGAFICYTCGHLCDCEGEE